MLIKFCNNTIQLQISSVELTLTSMISLSKFDQVDRSGYCAVVWVTSYLQIFLTIDIE